MLRFVAFSFLVCAAFAWSLPFTDRVGTAALGFAFLALGVGRGWGVARPTVSPFGRRPATELDDDDARIIEEVGEVARVFGSEGWR